MTRSMTGYATQAILLKGQDESKASMNFHLKSLNSRYFDTNFRLPYPLSNWETEFAQLFKKRLLRGYVSFNVQLSNQSIFKGPIEPAISIIKGYVNAINNIQKECNISGTVHISDLLVLPNVFNAPEQELDPQTKEMIFTLVDKLVDELIGAQEKEGAELAQDIQGRIKIMQEEIEKISGAFETVMEAQKKKVHAGLEEIGLDESKYADLQRNALYNYLDKIDIHEEITRFKNHLKNVKQVLESNQIEKGKRLDFILQELHREINTITAKCSDSTISSHAINCKVEIEKAREQVQNLV